jgi:hypothetical protein
VAGEGGAWELALEVGVPIWGIGGGGAHRGGGGVVAVKKVDGGGETAVRCLGWGRNGRRRP